RRVGHEIRAIEPGASRVTTDVSRLGAGVYFARLVVGDEDAFRRFVVAR
ncbi:unnamed protein product, partial [marine sediment metagenome]